MRYHVLAADYDGTLAHHGKIDAVTWTALRRLRESGRRLVMVTGRELDELLALLEYPELFDRIVAENGALIYRPDTREIRLLSAAPPERFVAELRRRGVEPMAVGRVIVATWEPHQDAVLHVIRELGLEMQVIFNKGAVMVLPSGINKATGLSAALTELGFSAHNAVGVGDAENDHAMLQLCECGVAVSNALPALKETADFLTRADHGAGVAELIGHLLADDLQAAHATLIRHRVLLGLDDAAADRRIDPVSSGVMVFGTSGSGKSTLTTGLLERFAAAGYQFVIIDPEGDYTALEFAVVLGGPQRGPLVDEVLEVLRDPVRNVIVNLLGVALDHRPAFFAELLPALVELRSRTGRPHWIVIDEAHHLLPVNWHPSFESLPAQLRGALFITVHPGNVAPSVLQHIDTLLVVGQEPEASLKEFCDAAGEACPSMTHTGPLPSGDVIFWPRGAPEAVLIHSEKPKSERKRHSRKYAEGILPPDRSFYFRGPDAKLNLKAHNLMMFLQMAEGVDDETWSFHLGKGEYSQWFREKVKDADLGDDVAEIEVNAGLTPKESRAAVRTAIEKRYTLPSEKPSGAV